MKRIAYALLGVSLAFLLVSCGSKPKDEPTELQAPVDSTIEEPVVDEGTTEPAEVVTRDVAMELVSEASNLKKKIDDNGFASYSQKDYDAASALLAEIDALIADENTSPADIAAKAKEAVSKYKVVLHVAYKKLSQSARLTAFENKRKCDSIKAGIAEKERYTEATDLFKAGDNAFSIQNPESAYNKYTKSAEIYGDIFNSVSVKREAAAKALEAAKAKVADAAAYAEEADETNPLKGENIQGIEAEDTVLLEEDYYENEVAVEEVPEVLDAPDFEEVTEELIEVSE